MAAARQKEINDSMTVVATKTGMAGRRSFSRVAFIGPVPSMNIRPQGIKKASRFQQKGRKGRLFRIKPVADPRLGLDVLRRPWILLQLFAKVGDEDAQILRLLRAVAAPDGSENG